MNSSEDNRNVLCIRFSALGDIALALPVVFDLCRANPSVRFIFLTRRFPASLFINAPENLTVIGVDLNQYKGLAGLHRLYRHIKTEYDIHHVVDLHDVIRSRILSAFFRLSGAKVTTIRKGRKEKKELTRPSHKILLQLPSSAERYADTFRRAGFRFKPLFHSVFDHHISDPAIYAKASAPKLPHQKWIAIAPFARHRGKIYPPELMRQVIDGLLDIPDAKIFLFGAGENEKKILSRWADNNPRIIDLASIQLGLPAELRLLADCDLMVSMDSANMHFASLVGCPVVSVWGATHPFAGFMGFGQKTDNAVQLDMSCRPCSVFGDKPCRRGDYHCLNGIPPAAIVTKVRQILSC